MSLQLTKPVGYSFGSNYVQGRIAKANAVKAALDKQIPLKDPPRIRPAQPHLRLR
jgi:hypothetical protein